MPLLPSFAGGSKLPGNKNSSSQAYHKCLVKTGSKKIAEPLESIRFGDLCLFILPVWFLPHPLRNFRNP